MAKNSYNYSVFINCPIDDSYTPRLRAMIFSILRCGFTARSALEESDSSEIRLNKIFRIITECRYGIHDLSRTQLDRKSRLPRFNMPLELGIFLAAKYYGREEHDRKRCIIFEAKAHTYEKFISDIKGQDISAHNNSPEKIVKMIRDWLATCSPKATIIGGNAVWRDYGLFSTWLPKQCRKKRLTLSTLIFGDYINLIYEWIESRS